MPLNPDALTSVATARSYLRDPDADTTRLELLINSFSRAIHSYCEREFRSLLSPPDNQPRVFEYDGSGYLSLAPYEARAVNQVVLYTDLPTASQVALNPGSATVEAEYRLRPRKKTKEGTYLWMLLPKRDLRLRRFGSVEVTVTADWGAGTVPADVELACLIAVADNWRNPESFASRQLGELSFAEAPDLTQDVGRALPAASRSLLGPYRRAAL